MVCASNTATVDDGRRVTAELPFLESTAFVRVAHVIKHTQNMLRSYELRQTQQVEISTVRLRRDEL